MSRHDERVEQIIANRKRYCEALRSGEFYQVRHALSDPADMMHGKCAVGVAAAIFPIYHYVPLFERIAGILGITRQQAVDISRLNDFEYYSFEQIAEHVEQLPIYIREAA